jgi:hypothetical protein
MGKIVVQYKTSFGVNDKSEGIRQRIGAVLIWLAQRVDSSRLYTVVVMRSSPEVSEQARIGCLLRGFNVAKNLFTSEVRQEAGEIAMRAAAPKLFKDEKSRG